MTAPSRPSPMPWWEPRVGARERELVLEVLAGNFLNDGDVTTRFERALAERLGCRHAVGVTSGTSALFLALVAAGVGPGDEVIIPDITFIATANAVTLAGARPILVDVLPDSLTIDPAAAARAATPRTKAVIPVHVSGRAADMPALAAWAAPRRIAVIEDAAEALQSRSNGRCLGTFGIAGCLSFAPNKTITTGQGGVVLTNDDAFHVRLRELKDQGRAARGTGGDDLHPRVGYNFKLTNLQAAVGLGQLSVLDERMKRLQSFYRRYEAGLAGIPGVRLLPFRVDEGESPQWIDVLAERRDDLERHLLDRGYACRRYWFPLHTQAPYRGADGDFPVSTRTAPRALWLPSSFLLTDEDIDAVCGHIRSFYLGSAPR